MSEAGTPSGERRPSSQNLSGLHPDAATFELRDKLLFAVPKKGRLNEQCLELLERIGLKYRRKPRLDIAFCTNLPVALVFLPAADIPRYVANSHVDLGITGEDMIAEKDVDLEVGAKLGFGKCKLCLQAPVSKEYKGGEDLVGAKISTSFPNLTRKYFKEKGGVTETKVTYLSGSVEVACGLGLADAIVDLVESGDTMVAHNLCVVDTLMQTEAVLVSNAKTSFPKMVKKLNRRVQGVIAAKQYKMLTYNIKKSCLEEASALTPGQTAPTVTALVDPEWVAVQAMVKSAQTHEMMDKLAELGAVAILTTDISNTRLFVE
eukprot:TRINITY_DN963_c2_g1_i1.p1 TRINITY_DN963_c2_g1~~TRINITY_DN963_c2_g1_i1.p1  ORF type:complete len:336 (+),score=103.87 TRINITY_DN963_c2_g1_i1:54-1010(+)